MAVNKNFVVKNGLEVGSRLIVADAQDLHVGLGTTAPLTRLDVRGDVRFADDGGTVNTVDIAGITTFRKDVVIGVGATVAKFDIDSGNLGIHSTSPRFALDVKAGAGDTLAALFHDDIYAPNIVVSGGSINYIVAIAATIGTLGVTGIATANQLAVSGVTTLAQNGGITTTGGDLYVGGDLFVKDDVVYDEVTGRNLNITGVGTIAQIHGDGSNITGLATALNAAIGISSGTSFIGAGVTVLDFGTAGTTVSSPSAGIATVVTPVGASIGLVIALGG
jgi:hypothetical protein